MQPWDRRNTALRASGAACAALRRRTSASDAGRASAPGSATLCTPRPAVSSSWADLILSCTSVEAPALRAMNEHSDLAIGAPQAAYCQVSIVAEVPC